MKTKSECRRAQADIRAYALKTLSNARQRLVQEHLRQCAACRMALEAARNQLDLLHVLAAEEPPQGLAERTLASISPPRASYARFVAVAAIVLLIALPISHSLSKSREAARRASTQGNMKQFGLIFKMYANESEGGLWPVLQEGRGNWVPDLAGLHEKFIQDTDFMVSEQHPDPRALKQELARDWDSSAPDLEHASQLLGESFAYLGFSVRNEEDFERLRVARAEHRLSSTSPPGSDGETASLLQPLREGIERFLITDINNSAATSPAQSSIPVLIEIATWKYKKSEFSFKGTSVLYLDGHVEFVPLGTFPVLAPILDTLSGMN